MMKIYGLIAFTSYFLPFSITVSWGDGTTNWRSGPPDGLPELTKLSVDCGKDEMTIYLAFSAPFDGTIYSKANGHSSRCVHVAPHSHITEATFTVEYDKCGTRSDPKGKYYENTIIIQYDDIVIEAWDEAKKIRCEWHDGYEKSAYKMPITISDLDVVEMNFQGDDVDCWLEVQDGKGPWSAKVEGLVPLGSPLTLVVAIQDSESQFDMRVKSCIAHDGQKHPIHLTDEDGCVLRPKMMSPFQKTTETKGTASVIAYSHFYAFKFPETVEVTIQCTVEICRNGCPGTCTQGRDSLPANPEKKPSDKDSDDIPTYKDSYPFSTVITSRPNPYKNSSNLNTLNSVNGNENVSKEQDSEPLQSSPDIHNFFYSKYPYGLFDDLVAEDRQDKQEHPFEEEAEYSENKDDVYYSQFPNIFDVNAQGKNFPLQQKIQNLLNKTENKSFSEIETTTHDILLLSTVDQDFIKHSLSTENSEFEENTEKPLETDLITETNKETVLNGSQHQSYEADALISKNDNENELFEHDIQSQVVNQLLKSESEENTTAELNSGSYIESNEYNDAFVESKEAVSDYYEYSSNRKVNEEDTLGKNFPEMEFDDYRVKARKPLDNYEAKQSYEFQNYRPFVPPAPLPPLTLYNGIPLHYYSHHSTNVEFLDRDGFQYMNRYPSQKEYIKSKLRRPGRRRGRREIGENEQLGLKQTLRVIATTDLEFVTKDSKEIKPLYVGKTDFSNDVCIAPSSFAAGLGLLLLANICVLCVVVFLGHHYYIHKKIKIKTVELLGTELS
ncbi:uncharacterized protein LOC118187399 [Stegodyphus dumicola]|uniref:uncharacterized protein LOC118187399 n=1 Tax=Stegodyphus dumicola TaxID=202533 RepID=UPI0015A9CA7E|nr:uncharacterized protein LOC118187399 [Stegodyphus dumicola]